MKRILVLLAFLMPFGLVFAQGINFEQKLSWQQLLDKAKLENKYLFVDCYATWCGPCKQMDFEVYPNAEVGQLMNNQFISVKIQVDSSKLDDENVKTMYADAKMLSKRYPVPVLPTYLFFSPEGNLVYRSTSYQPAKVFIATANAALDPVQRAFYQQVEDYKNGKKDYSHMLAIIKKTKEFLGDIELARKMAKDLKENYLDHLSEDELATKENLVFISEHYELLNSNGIYFDLIYHRPEKADRIVDNPSYSKIEVENIIGKEEIWSKLYQDDKFTKPYTKKPSWWNLYTNIKNKYGQSYADKLIPGAKLRFYRSILDWKTFAALRDEQIKLKAPVRVRPGGLLDGDNSWSLNGDAWDVFTKSKDKQVLKKALAWSDLSIKLEEPDPNIQYLDTRANLLYKLGRINEAIAQEQQALSVDLKIANQMGRESSALTSSLKKTIDQMKHREATWPVPANKS